jgi:hypothetical protein
MAGKIEKEASPESPENGHERLPIKPREAARAQLLNRLSRQQQPNCLGPIHYRTVPMLYRCGYFVPFWAISAFLESANYTFHKASMNRGSNSCRGASLYFQLLAEYFAPFLYRCCTDPKFG